MESKGDGYRRFSIGFGGGEIQTSLNLNLRWPSVWRAKVMVFHGFWRRRNSDFPCFTTSYTHVRVSYREQTAHPRRSYFCDFHISLYSAMSDKLELVNTTNAKAKTLTVRIMQPTTRDIDVKNMTVFSVKLLTETYHYTDGEVMIFGPSGKRKDMLQAVQTKWKDRSLWKLSKMFAKAKNTQFNSSPHQCIINLGDKALKSEAVKETDAEGQKIPKELEPRLAPTQLLEFTTAKVVDAYGYVTNITEPENINRKQKVQVTLCGEAGKTIPLDFWESASDDSTFHLLKKVTKDKVLYVFGAWLVKDWA